MSSMRAPVVCILLLLCLCVPLAAQSRGIVVYIPQVTGTAGGSGDAGHFTDMLVMEVTARNYELGDTQAVADYLLRGSVETADQEDPAAAPQYGLHLALIDNQSGETLIEQDLMYGTLEEANQYLPVLVFTMLANIPMSAFPPAAGPAVSDAWRNKWLFFGFYGFWTPRLYEGTSLFANLLNFGGGLALEVYPLDFLSFGAGVEYAQDVIVVSALEDLTFKGHLLEFPLMLKPAIKLGAHSLIEPYGGAQINIPLNDATKPPLLSWLTGLRYNVNVGSGALFMDIRFSADLGNSSLEKTSNNTNLPHYDRYTMKLAIGYKIGFFSKKKK